MRAGRLDRKITILERVIEKNSFGEHVASYDSLATVCAEAKPASGSERYVAQQFVAEITHIFTIRYRNDVTPLNRIRFDGRDFDILAVLEIGRREGLAINAKARAE